jgi:splicing factor U2AF subunit
MPGIHVPGVVSTNVPDSINKIFVGGLPAYLNEEQVQELLTSFGELKAFNLVRENNNGPSKVYIHSAFDGHRCSHERQGFAFFEYVDPAVTDIAIQSLNGMELGDKFLVVQRASVGAAKGLAGVPAEAFRAPELPRPIMPAGDPSAGTDIGSRILMMLNMVAPEDLTDDTEYGDILEDVRDECGKFGPVADLRVPRPARRDRAKWGEQASQLSAADAQRMDEAAGVGRVYVKFEDPYSAQAALQALAGRSFGGRSIIATLLSDDSNTTPPLNIIFAPAPEAPPPLPIE